MRLAVLFAPAILLLAACGGGGSSNATTTTGPTRTDVANLPAPAPAGAIVLTEYHLFPTVALNTTLVTLPLINTIPSGYKTTWYTYKDGAWVALEAATIIGGNAPNAQIAFSPVPENVIVFAEPQ
jgi:hypothetical protein